jgi:hypothetical protein
LQKENKDMVSTGEHLRVVEGDLTNGAKFMLFGCGCCQRPFADFLGAGDGVVASMIRNDIAVDENPMALACVSWT